jgi:ferritin-like metal-binding protein YciE
MSTDLHDQLTKYLTDAHSIEEQALAQLRRAPDIAGDDELSRNYREHLRETEGHESEARRLLEVRDAKPSRVKDTVMAVGGKGFLLFARLQPDTPGKLHAHALSYEALELSSYELLGGVAELAEELEVVEAAQRIAGEEREMMQRLEATFDRAVDASLREVGRDDLDEQLRKYLADAHAIEEQAAALLERGPNLAGDSTLADIYARHLEETRRHAEAVEQRLNALGGDPSSVKDAAMRLGALNWGASRPVPATRRPCEWSATSSPTNVALRTRSRARSIARCKRLCARRTSSVVRELRSSRRSPELRMTAPTCEA